MLTVPRIRPSVQPARRRLALLESLAPPDPVELPFAVGIARPSRPARVRAPRGGATVDGKFYRGGSFLPATGDATPANPRDGWPAWTEENVWELGPDEGARPTPAPEPAPVAAPSPARFAIHGFTYTAREIPAGESGSVAFELHKIETNHHYHVIRDNYGLVKCDCPDYLFRCEGTGQMCKHGSKLVGLGLVPAPSPVASTLGRVEFITPMCAVVRNATPTRVEYPAPRPRRFEPTPEDMAEAAQLFADVARRF